MRSSTGALAPGAEHDPRIDVGLTTVAVVVCTVFTLLVAFMPWAHVALRGHTAHLVLDTADACIALLVAYLLWGRFVRGRRLADLLMVQALLMLALAGIGLSALMTFALDQPRGTVDAWLPMGLRLVAASLLAVAALPVTDTVVRRATVCWAVAVPWTAIAGIAVALWIFRDDLPPAVDPFPPMVRLQTDFIMGHPLLTATHVATAVLLLSAALGFTAKATRHFDELLRWLGPACALGAFARVHYAMNPTLYTDWLYTGDMLRTAFHAVLLVGAIRELGQYWSGLAAKAVLEDRRRLAREIHDGVMQELGFIRSATHDIPSGAPVAARIEEAATRALDEARAAVHALRRLETEPPAQVLQRAAREVAERYGVALETEVDLGVETEVEQVHTLSRITREAVTNAARHGAAQVVTLTLRCEGDLRVLSVRDDGVGFARARPETRGSGYGVMTMRERAEALPGTFEIESQPGSGSVVTVTW